MKNEHDEKLLEKRGRNRIKNRTKKVKIEGKPLFILLDSELKAFRKFLLNLPNSTLYILTMKVGAKSNIYSALKKSFADIDSIKS